MKNLKYLLFFLLVSYKNNEIVIYQRPNAEKKVGSVIKIKNTLNKNYLIKFNPKQKQNYTKWIKESELSPLGDKSETVNNIPTKRQISNSSFDETKINLPIKEVNDSNFHTTLCGGKDAGYDLCISRDSNLVESIRITNFGGNTIVTKNEYYINRSFEFSFEDQARSDIRLLVVDSPDEKTSHATYSVITFLPRINLPAIRLENNNLILTLNNNEEIIFNGSTHEITGGVLTEGPMKQNDIGKAIPASLTYTGKGVMIRADKTGDLPIGDTEDAKGNVISSTSTATVFKNGKEPCKILAKEIWYTDYSKASNIFIKKELASDEGMNSFLKNKCGFSIN